MALEALCRRLTRISLQPIRPPRAVRCLATSTFLRQSTDETPFEAAPPIDSASLTTDAASVSTTPSNAAIPTAPPASPSTFEPPPLGPIDSSILSRLRVVPASGSYFTTIPGFTDDYLLAATLLARYSTLPTTLPELIPRAKWISLARYHNTAREKVRATRFQRMITMYKRLNKIHPDYMPPEVAKKLDSFRTIVDETVRRPKVVLIDEHGRTRAVGRRKNASAVVWIVEGEGEVRVNGKTLAQAFSRQHDRESAIWPLLVTQRVDKYNVWAIAKGGGTTGQAEAVTLGLARALLAMEPGLSRALRKAGVLFRDPRMVERKKPGKRGARKMPAWVKR